MNTVTGWQLNPCSCTEFRKHLRLRSPDGEIWEVLSKESGFTLIFRIYQQGDMGEPTVDELRTGISKADIAEKLGPLPEEEIDCFIEVLSEHSIEEAADILDEHVELERITFEDEDRILGFLRKFQTVRETIYAAMHPPERPRMSRRIM